MDEKHITGRQRVLKAATIEFGGGAIDCTIRNWSAIGAALDVSSPLGISAHFTLFVPADGRHWPLPRGLAQGEADRRRVRIRTVWTDCRQRGKLESFAKSQKKLLTLP
jgi:hypothetical protein